MAQACHAATAAVVSSFSTSDTLSYTSDLDGMTVCVLGVESKDELEELARTLGANDIPHHLWIEKPENTPTALATAPLSRDKVAGFFDHLKLLR